MVKDLSNDSEKTRAGQPFLADLSGLSRIAASTSFEIWARKLKLYGVFFSISIYMDFSWQNTFVSRATTTGAGRHLSACGPPTSCISD
jgi:hypothetical protein